MSMFLGPIHYLMFNKIKIAANRSHMIVSVFKEKYGAVAEEAVAEALPNGPVDFGDTPLEELLGDNPIHSFLQSLIDKVEMAEATLVTALLYRFPDDGRELLTSAFRQHGAKTAKEMEVPLGDLRSIANSLGQYYLEGMPCDQVSSYRLNDEHTLTVGHHDCLHRAKWEEVGAPEDVMCELLDEWVTGFVRAIKPDAKISRSASIVGGESSCSCVITA